MYLQNHSFIYETMLLGSHDEIMSIILVVNNVF